MQAIKSSALMKLVALLVSFEYFPRKSCRTLCFLTFFCGMRVLLKHEKKGTKNKKRRKDDKTGENFKLLKRTSV